MDKILVLDFGGQYDQLIARRVREQNVYAEIRDWRGFQIEEIKKKGYKGVIFTGGPDSVYGENAPMTVRDILYLDVPVLGICYGAQLIAWLEEGRVESAKDAGEYGRTQLRAEESVLFEDVPETSVCWMSHSDFISRLPASYRKTAHTPHCPIAAFENAERKIYGVQFHPEVMHTEYGTKILSNFVFKVCHCLADWNTGDFITRFLEEYPKTHKGKKVLLGLSGGVDSSVAAALLHEAIGRDLVCVFVDHGLLRKNEGDQVEEVFGKQFGMNLIRVNAKDRFLEALKGAREPEKKRKIIGEQFIRVFEEEARRLGKIDILAQGTIYPDVVESGKSGSAVIKSHHNVGGLPEKMDFEEISEPLKDLFKDEVREVGLKLGLPENLVFRQPFPGPGLAVRIMGEITEEKIRILQEADAIFREGMARAGNLRPARQYLGGVTETLSVGGTGDARFYGDVLALRSVPTDDFMTAEWTRIPYEVLERAAVRIVNEVGPISRVVYDITSKPPGTVEWE